MSRIVTLLMFACLMLAVANAQATTWTVTRTSDYLDSVCDSDCSLREAIGDALDGDTIVFSSLFNTAQTITLLPLHGNLYISKDLTIVGPGADLLTISGGSAASPIFDISSAITVTLSGMTITGSLDEGIVNRSDLTIVQCNISGNDGHGIFNDPYGGVSVVVDRSTITGNTGTGIYNEGAVVLTVDSSTITENAGVGVFGLGGGITTGYDLYLSNSTVSNNTAGCSPCGSAAGGIYSSGDGTILDINNSTISGNAAPQGNYNGGGILITGSSQYATILNSTITNNSAGTFSPAGGVSTVFGTSVVIGNTIVAGNSTTPDVAGTFNSVGYNLIGDVGTATGFLPGDQIGANPLLDPLGDYGGRTQTHRLQTNSPAIDQGNSFGSTTDQRGLPYVRPHDNPSIPNPPGGNGADNGAYERLFATIITGTVRGPLGDPIRNAQVVMRSDTGRIRTVSTNESGRYRFRNVPTYHTYGFRVMHHLFEFMPKVVMVEEAPITLNFMAMP